LLRNLSIFKTVWETGGAPITAYEGNKVKRVYVSGISLKGLTSEAVLARRLLRKLGRIVYGGVAGGLCPW